MKSWLVPVLSGPVLYSSELGTDAGRASPPPPPGLPILAGLVNGRPSPVGLGGGSDLSLKRPVDEE